MFYSERALAAFAGRGIYHKGLGEQSLIFLEVGVEGLVILGYIFLIDCC